MFDLEISNAPLYFLSITWARDSMDPQPFLAGHSPNVLTPHSQTLLSNHFWQSPLLTMYIAAQPEGGSFRQGIIIIIIIIIIGTAKERDGPGDILVYMTIEGFPQMLSCHSDCVFGVDWGVGPDGKKFLMSASHDATCAYWRASV